jgi:hypothetical protein
LSRYNIWETWLIDGFLIFLFREEHKFKEPTSPITSAIGPHTSSPLRPLYTNSQIPLRFYPGAIESQVIRSSCGNSHGEPRRPLPAGRRPLSAGSLLPLISRVISVDCFASTPRNFPTGFPHGIEKQTHPPIYARLNLSNSIVL